MLCHSTTLLHQRGAILPRANNIQCLALETYCVAYVVYLSRRPLYDVIITVSANYGQECRANLSPRVLTPTTTIDTQHTWAPIVSGGHVHPQAATERNVPPDFCAEHFTNAHCIRNCTGNRAQCIVVRRRLYVKSIPFQPLIQWNLLCSKASRILRGHGLN